MKAAIFTEGSAEYGFGHINRCLGFAQVLSSRGANVEWALLGDDLAEGVLLANGMHARRLQDWTLQSVAAAAGDMDLVVLDSYHAPLSCYEHLAERAPRRLWIDDTARLDYPVGLVINPNPLVEQQSPRTGKDGRSLLSGFAYQPLRKEFLAGFGRKIPDTPVRILVTFGGTDPKCLTPFAVSAAKRTFPDATILAVVPREELRTVWQETLPGATFLPARSGAEMRLLMEQSDLAISAGGQTLLECLRMGLPTVALGAADNQRLQIEALRKSDALLFAGEWDSPNLSHRLESTLLDASSARRRDELARHGQELVDGEGCERCIAAAMSRQEGIALREARQEDVDAVWRISNALGTRRHSIGTEPIPWDTHVEWFRNTMESESSRFFVITENHDVVGQLRYHLDGCIARVSISLLERVRGLGAGARMLMEGDRRTFAAWPHVTALQAEISPLNTASMRAFQNAGYIPSSANAIHGNRIFHVFEKHRVDNQPIQQSGMSR